MTDERVELYAELLYLASDNPIDRAQNVLSTTPRPFAWLSGPTQEKYRRMARAVLSAVEAEEGMTDECAGNDEWIEEFCCKQPNDCKWGGVGPCHPAVYDWLRDNGWVQDPPLPNGIIGTRLWRRPV